MSGQQQGAFGIKRMLEDAMLEEALVSSSLHILVLEDHFNVSNVFFLFWASVFLLIVIRLQVFSCPQQLSR